MDETSKPWWQKYQTTLNKIVSKDKLQLNKAKQARAMNEQSSGSKDQSMKANQNMTKLL